MEYRAWSGRHVTLPARAHWHEGIRARPSCASRRRLAVLRPRIPWLASGGGDARWYHLPGDIARQLSAAGPCAAGECLARSNCGSNPGEPSFSQFEPSTAACRRCRGSRGD
eukprot:5893437-Prymnesium_polylepis.1